MAVLSHILCRINPLESIRTSWWHERKDAKLSTEFVRAITRYQKGLECLEIPRVSLVDYEAFEAIFTELPRLKAFVGGLVLPSNPGKDTSFESICHLRRVVITSDYNYSMFTQILSSSHTSLTSLAFRLGTTDDPVDLSWLPHLTFVRMEVHQILHDKPWTNMSPEVDFDRQPVSDNVRNTVKSLRALPIKTLSVTPQSPLMGYGYEDCPLLDVLPSSIVQFGAIATFFGRSQPNFSILANCIRNGLYPHLQRVSIYPEAQGGSQISGYLGDFQETAKIDLEDICHEFGIRVERAGELGDTVAYGACIDPLQTDSETESGDDWSEYEDGDFYNDD